MALARKTSALPGSRTAARSRASAPLYQRLTERAEAPTPSSSPVSQVMQQRAAATSAGVNAVRRKYTPTRQDEEQAFANQERLLRTVAGQANQGQAVDDSGQSVTDPYQASAQDAEKSFGIKQRRPGSLRDYAGNGLGGGLGYVKVRRLTPQEWAELDPETQQQITANFAAYQASIRDREAGNTENLDKVIKTFGFNNDKISREDFLSGRAIATEADFLPSNDAWRGAGEGRQQVLQSWSDSPVFDSPDLVSVLQTGTSLLEGLAVTQTIPGDVAELAGGRRSASESLAEMIAPEQMDNLYRVLQGLASRSVNENLMTDEQLNSDLRADLESTTRGLDPSLVANFFRENYPREGGDDILTLDEFERAWLK